MKKIILLFTISIFSLSTFAQKEVDSLFSSGGQFYEHKNYPEAIKCFKEIALHHPSSKRYYQSIYNLAYTYDDIDSTDQAIFWYEKIRASNVKDNKRIGGRGIFEPYSNYKHYSTFNIANIEYHKKNYEKALDYYKQCLAKYPYYNESGTDIRINKSRLKIYIVDCLTELKSYNEGLMVILPEALDSYGSSNYHNVVESAMKLIVQQFDKKELADELESSFKTMKKIRNKRQFEYTFKSKIIDLFPYMASKDIDVDSFILLIKQSDFWTQLVS